MLIKIGSALVDPCEIVAISKPMNDYFYDLEEEAMVRIEFRSGSNIWVDATMDEAEAALIDAGVVTDLTADYDEEKSLLPLLRNDEVDALRKLADDGYRFLARDKDGKLFAFRHKPKYGGFYWDDPDPAPALQVSGLSFISEEDDEPTEISSLLGD